MNKTMQRIADAVAGHKDLTITARNMDTGARGERYKVRDGRVYYWGTMVVWPDLSKPGNLAFSMRGWSTPTTIKVINAALSGFGRPDVSLGMHRYASELRLHSGPHGLRCFYLCDVASREGILTVGKAGDPEPYTGI